MPLYLCAKTHRKPDQSSVCLYSVFKKQWHFSAYLSTRLPWHRFRTKSSIQNLVYVTIKTQCFWFLFSRRFYFYWCSECVMPHRQVIESSRTLLLGSTRHILNFAGSGGILSPVTQEVNVGRNTITFIVTNRSQRVIWRSIYQLFS